METLRLKLLYTVFKIKLLPLSHSSPFFFFLWPASPLGQNLQTNAPELEAGIVAHFSQSDTPGLGLGCYLGL